MSHPSGPPECCDYCGLPLPGPSGSSTDASGEREPAYCCFGCRFAVAVARGDGEDDGAESQRTLTRLGLAVFCSMNVMVFTMALWTLDLYEFDAESGVAGSYHGLFRHLAMLAAIPVLFLLGLPLFEAAVDDARRGRPGSDLLLATGVAASFAYSMASVLLDRGQVYFEVGCAILVLVTLGRWLEATGKLRTTRALDRLERLLPATVRRVVDGGEVETPLAEVVPGDRLRVLPGERFPTDGRLAGGGATVDEQILTGESRPVLKAGGDPIHGGTLNLDADLVLVVTAAGGAGTLDRLIDLVRRARASKGRYQRVADRTSAVFFPGVTTLAILAAVGHGMADGPERGLLVGLSVVLIACPCALALATPIAVWSALGRAASHQVLFRSGEALERLAEVRAVWFDKTGTLTTGTPRVRSLVVEQADEREVIRRAAALSRSSGHALARAILDHAGNAPDAGAVEGARAVAGRGVTAELAPGEGLTVLGHPTFLAERGMGSGPRTTAAINEAREGGATLSLIGWSGRVRGVFAFDEDLRDEAERAVAWCRTAGLDVRVLTGDHAGRGAALAAQLDVPVSAGLRPEDKVAAIREGRERLGGLAMVGDGINDAPALAASDVGIAMGCGADVSRDSAQVCLLSDDLARLPWAIDLARRTVGVVRQNLAWSFGYNALGVVAAASGRLNPAFAAFLMVASSLLVIGNSLRLGHMPLGTGPESSTSPQDAGRIEVPMAGGVAR